MTRNICSWLVTAAVLSVLTACGGDDEAANDGTLRVGVILPMSGEQATYGEESWNGMELAREDLERAGLPEVEITVDGKKKKVPLKLKLMLRDEVSKKAQASTNARTLIDSERVHALLGSVASAHTKAIFQEARESEVPCITPASTNDTLTKDGGPYTSRICYQDNVQGAVLARFAKNKSWKRAAVVIDKQQDYSVGLAKNFRASFEADGGTSTAHYYITTDADFSNVIQSVATDNPDVIFISGYYSQAGPMIKQAQEKWKGKPIIGGDGLDSPQFIALLGDTSADIFLTTHFAADAPQEHVRSFAKRYKDKFKKSPGAMAALGYDVLIVLIDAVKRAKDPFSPESLAKAIRETKDVKGITGSISLDNPNRTPDKDLVIVKVDGGFKFQKAISPK